MERISHSASGTCRSRGVPADRYETQCAPTPLIAAALGLAMAVSALVLFTPGSLWVRMKSTCVWALLATAILWIPVISTSRSSFGGSFPR